MASGIPCKQGQSLQRLQLLGLASPPQQAKHAEAPLLTHGVVWLVLVWTFGVFSNAKDQASSLLDGSLRKTPTLCSHIWVDIS